LIQAYFKNCKVIGLADRIGFFLFLCFAGFSLVSPSFSSAQSGEAGGNGDKGYYGRPEQQKRRSETLESSLKPITLEGSNDYGRLVIQWVGVIDNGEGDGTHGPLGSLHILIYPVSADCPGKARSYSGYLKHIYLSGPSSGEWLDGDAMTINNLELFRWRHADDAVIVFVYESDPHKGFGWMSGRAHDPVFCAIISRQNTLSSNIVGDDYRPAADDAIRNCRRGGITWYQDVWSSGLNPGIPNMFIKFKTIGQKRSYSNSTAEFEKVWVDHNYYQNGQKGMLMHFRFSVYNHERYHASLAVYFSYEQGSALRDFDGRYNTTDGHVSTEEDFSPNFTNTLFEDFKVFMPYDQLHMAKGRHDLKFIAQIWDHSTHSSRMIGTSDPFSFSYSSW
jgi:hypothetical protein